MVLRQQMFCRNKNTIDPYLTSHTNVNSRSTEDLNEKTTAPKLSEFNVIPL